MGEIGHAALITSFSTFERCDALTFADGWRSGAAHLRRLVGMSLLLAIPILAILAIAAVIAIVLIDDTGDYVINEPLWWIGVPLLIVLGLAFVISASTANVLQAFARRAIVLEQSSVVDGLKRSREIFRARIRSCIGLSIRMLLIADVIGAIAAIPMILFGAVLLIGFPSLRQLPWPLTMIGTAGVALSSFIVGSAVTVAGSAAWTLAWREFTRATTDDPPTPA